MSNHVATLLLSTILAAALSLPTTGPQPQSTAQTNKPIPAGSLAGAGGEFGHGNERPKVTLRKVYEVQVGRFTAAYLDPDGERIYLRDNSGRTTELKILDWKKGAIVTSRKFSDIKCKYVFGFDQFTFVPSNDEILTEACGDLYLIDKNNLSIRKKFPVNSRVLTLPNGRTLLLYGYGSKPEFLLLDTQSWEVQATWPFAGEIDTVAVNSGGQFIIILHDREKNCGVTVLRFPSGEAFAEFSIPSCSEVGILRDVPEAPNLFATLEYRQGSGVSLSTWDIRSGTLAHEILLEDSRLYGIEHFSFEHSFSEGAAPFAISPDLSWAIGHVGREPEFQEFVAWDLTTGKALLQSPKMKSWQFGPFPPTTSFAISTNGSYVQATTFPVSGRLEHGVKVYEVVAIH